MDRFILSRIRGWYHLAIAFLAALVHRFPSQRLVVIGVTGTNGKTTVVHVLHDLLRTAGFAVGSVSSLRFKINDHEEVNLLKMTMPGRGRLQKFLAECRDAGCSFVILEATSEGMAQFRHRFIQFRAAVLTNVTPEHIESHGSFEAYRNAKLELFRRLPRSGTAVLNREDQSSQLFSEATRAEKVWYSRTEIELKRVGHPVRVLGVSPHRIQMEIGNVFMEPNLGGIFNVPNVIAAAATALAFGVSPTSLTEGCKRLGALPGRLEYVQETPFGVVVDYAHTPDALEQVYRTLTGGSNSKFEIRNSKLICVLGSAGGGRDKWKRPEMGKIAATHCKEIILTSEDPDDEDPSQIVSEIQSGTTNSQGPMTKVVLDRREAIGTALRDAKPGDTVVITGMGAQPWFMARGGKVAWDERAIVREELAKISHSA